MSFAIRMRPMACRVAARPLVQRPFSVSSMRALKESDHSHPNAAEQYETHKQDQIKKQKEGKGHWKPELASNSEEAVAADRTHDGSTPEELQKKTADHAEKKHKAGTSQDSGL